MAKYQALYRKYRPESFDEIYGQDIIKKILINSIKNNKIAHAYLFYGPRGTGKTSIAKMLARIVNCENAIDGNACKKCKSCEQSRNKECIDIIEIDAASNNGVDEIRDLKNKINLVPNYLKYKVYIIDEVHMLSTGAFNALLKTLEEPPEHVIFILATTEIYEVPSTIISRCQLLEFKNIDNTNLKNRLLDISNKENIKIDELAINEIVKNSSGGMRDAIGLLDKLNAFCESKITVDDVRMVMGIASIGEITEFADLLINNTTDKLLQKIELYYNSGQDLLKIIEEVIIELRKKILLNTECEYINIINELLELENKIIYTKNKKIVFDLYIMNKTNVRENENKIIKKIEINQNSKSLQINENLKSEENYNKKSETVDKKIIDIRVNNTFAGVNKSIINKIRDKWDDLKEYVFDTETGSLICNLFDSYPAAASNTNLIIVTKYDSGANKINIDIEKYEKILFDKLQISNKLIALSTDEWNIIKKAFIKNNKEGIKYEYISENQIETKIKKEIVNKNKKENIKEKAEALFGDLVI